MKRLLFFMIMCLVFFTFTSFSSDNVKVEIDNKIISFDVEPVIEKDRVMVPLRKIFEELGALVSWNDDTKTVTATRENTVIKLNIGSNVMYKNNQSILLSPSPFILNGRTLIPIRVISESFDYEVSWNDSLKKVIIQTKTNADIETEEEAVISDFESEVLRLVNIERKNNGLSALTLDTSLTSVAYAHSKDMHDNAYFSHTNLLGQSPFDRLKSAGIAYGCAGENIAAGQVTPKDVVSTWMNSEGHRKNILNSAYNKMGLGYYSGSKGYKTYWTQIFTN